MNTTIAPDQRYTHYHPCPICSGFASAKQGKGERCWGYLSSDGTRAYCTRGEKAGSLELYKDAGYPHILHGKCKCGDTHGQAQNKQKAASGTRKKDPSDFFTYDDPRAVARYPYYDEVGTLLFVAVRYEWEDKDNPKGHSKTIRYFHKEGSTWKPGIGDIRRVLYRLPDMLKADPKLLVYIVEGENKVDELRKMGLVAICNPMGAKKWQDSYSIWLKGRNIVILPDNDTDGHEHAAQVKKSLAGNAASARIIELPGLSEKGDIIDWLKAGGTREQLEQLSALPKRKFLYASQVQPEPVDWLWNKRIACGMLTLLVGDPGLGKSLLDVKLVSAITTNGQLPDGKAIAPGGVVIMAPEDSYKHTLVPRLIAAGADLRKVLLLSEVPDFDSEGNQYQRPISFPEDAGILEEAIHDCKAKLAIIDPVLAMVDGKYDSHKDQESRAALSRVLAVAERTNCALLGVFHLNKSQSGNVLYRSTASIAFIAMARVGLFLVPDPDNPENGRVLVNHKNNLAAKATSLRLSIEQTADEIGYVEWRGESQYTESQLLNQRTVMDVPQSEAETGLMAVLKRNEQAMAVDEIYAQLETDQSFDALLKMLQRKVAQGALIRPARGKYTYSGNPFYVDTPKPTTETDVQNVQCPMSNSDQDIGHDVQFEDWHKSASEVPLEQMDILDMSNCKATTIAANQETYDGPFPPPDRATYCCRSRAWRWNGEQYVCGECQPVREAVMA